MKEGIVKKNNTIKLIRINTESYDQSLFPINIDLNIQSELIASLEVPSILRKKFTAEGIARLGDLQGLDVSTFLAWNGFGVICIKELCSFLNKFRSGEIKKLPTDESSVPIISEELSSEILVFKIDKLNVPTILKSRFKSSYFLRSRKIIIDTVKDFIEMCESGKLPCAGIGLRTLRQVFKEIDTLRQIGTTAYLKNVTLDNQSFLQIIALTRDKLILRDQIIFDHRIVPLNKSFLTLQEVAQLITLTRERVRQLEEEIVKKFQNGTLREFGWTIRRNALKQFRNPSDEFTFKQFIENDFFEGCGDTDSKVPPPIFFLIKVFYATFIISKDRIRLTDNSKCNFINYLRKNYVSNPNGEATIISLSESIRKDLNMPDEI